MKKLIAGNWKMNGSLVQSKDLVTSIIDAIHKNPSLKSSCDFLVCPPSLYMCHIKEICKSNDILLGGQNCSTHEQGAYTGDISASMIKDCGGTYVILGHSERRQYHKETNELIAEKAETAHNAGLFTIICVGETESEREAGLEEKVVIDQVLNSLPKSSNSENTVIAYEPVWAIGTGKTASIDDVATMHGIIRNTLKSRLAAYQNMRILYGGSMKPENAKDLLSTPNVDGGLIGGASLKADDFVKIGNMAP